jgi:hypothetical protein
LKAGCRITGPPRSFPPDALVMRRAMATKPKRTPEEIAEIILLLFARYGIDLPPRDQDGGPFERVLYLALRDGLLRLQLKRTGPRPKRIGEYGRDLVNAVEGLQAQALQAGTPLSNAKALKALQEQDPNKWGRDFRTLEKAYYEAKKRWFFIRKLEKFFAPLQETPKLENGDPEIK